MKNINKTSIIKSLFLLSFMTFFAVSGYAQSTKVPSKVKMAFMKKFPKIKNVKWEKESENNYEANFMKNGKKLSANFNSSGKWLETERNISVSQIPAKIMKALKKKYPNSNIKNAVDVWNSKGQQYELSAVVKGKTMQLEYTANGKLLSHS